MRETNIFNSWLELDCFCMDIAEAWIKYRRANELTVTYDEFIDWVTEQLTPAFECNFADVYEDEFGHKENEDDE